MEQLKENIEENSKKFGIVILFIIIVFIYIHKSSASPSLLQTTEKTTDGDKYFTINSNFWTNTFVPVYKKILDDEHKNLFKQNMIKGTVSDPDADIYILDCGYVFWKTQKNSTFISIKKANNSKRYNIDDSERYVDSLGVTSSQQGYTVKEGKETVTRINNNFIEPITELYQKLFNPIICTKCNTSNKSNLTKCTNCNTIIQILCNSCQILNLSSQQVCKRCEITPKNTNTNSQAYDNSPPPYDSIFHQSGGFSIYYKNKKNYKSLNI